MAHEKELPAADQVRESIRAYLQHIADIDIGTVLSPRGREIVGFCASWVENRLDEKWLADKVVPFTHSLEPEEKPEEEPAPRTESALTAASRARKEAEETVEALRADLEDERKYRHGIALQLEAVRKEAKLWEDYAEGVEDSDKSMRRIHALIISSDPIHPTGRCSCGGEGRCDWCKANPDPYQAEGTEAFDDFEPDVEGVMEALQDTQAYIASCLDADAKLQAVREAVESTTVGEWRNMTGYKRLHALLTTQGGGHG